MSPPSHPYDGRSSRRGLWTHWLPLVVTLSVATAGLAAWAWSQRQGEEGSNKVDEGSNSDDDSAEHEPYLDYENADYGDNPPYGASDRSRPSELQPPPRPDDGHSVEAAGTGWGARMSGALRRTPSPQQLLDSTGRTVAAGVAAAGAAMGKALASIREEDKAYAENPWSEEADAKKGRGPRRQTKRRRTVAVVLSADVPAPTADDSSSHELASILNHIPRHSDFSKIKLYILIYAPDAGNGAPEAATANPSATSPSSSFSNLGHDLAETPAEGSKKSRSESLSAFDSLYAQARALVEKESMILPFTTPSGYVHILRQIQPDIVYLQESLAGENGSTLANLQTWLRNEVVLVVGAENGSGGLADSESDAEKASTRKEVDSMWWQNRERVGRGRGIVVVDGMRVHDDWTRRVRGEE